MHDYNKTIIKTTGGDGKGYCIDGCQYNICEYLDEAIAEKKNGYRTKCHLFNKSKTATIALKECDDLFGTYYEGNPCECKTVADGSTKKSMPIYKKYLWYVLRHKWYVMLECFKNGMLWRGIAHDISKLLPSEFFPYAKWFYGEYGARFAKDEYCVADIIKHKTANHYFDLATEDHYKKNKHHWQSHVLPKDGIGPMQEKDIKEMVCDWRGFSKLQTGSDQSGEWYKNNSSRMRLLPKTKECIEKLLAVRK
jgi:hypothetical protein